MGPFTLEKTVVPHIQTKDVIGNIECFANDLYRVSVTHRKLDAYPFEIIHLVISRRDNLPVSSWSHMQKIKNELIGPEHTGVEVFPPESQLTDAANCYHMWVHVDDSFRLPFTLNPGRTVVYKE